MAIATYPAVSIAQADAPMSGKHILPAISWGASVNLAYNASGGSAVNTGPFSTGIIRIAQASGNVYVAIGNSGANAQSALNPGTLVIGPEVEFIAIPNGWFVAAISFDASTGTLNITSAVTNQNDLN